jgi:hypothetical protein
VGIEKEIILYELPVKHGISRNALPPHVRMLLAEARRMFALVDNANDGRYALSYMLDRAIAQFAHSSDATLVPYISFVKQCIARLSTNG